MSVDTPDSNGNTPLMYAAIAGQTKVTVTYILMIS